MSAAPAPSTNAPELPIPRHRREDDPRWLRRTNRIAAVVIFCYALGHVAILALTRVSPDTFNKAIAIYQHPAAVFAAAGIVGLALFHALCGLRVLAIDFTRWGAANARSLTSVVIVAWLASYVPIGYAIVRQTLLLTFGEG